jgi:hypothetical protein
MTPSSRPAVPENEASPVGGSTPRQLWLAAVAITGAILFFSGIAIAGLQSFSFSDTVCNGIVVRVIDGGPSQSPDQGCRRRETVRFWESVGLAEAAFGLVGLTWTAAGRSAHHPQRRDRAAVDSGSGG